MKKLFSSEARKLARRSEKRREKKRRESSPFICEHLAMIPSLNWMACSQYDIPRQTLAANDSSFNEESLTVRVWRGISY